MFLIRLMWVGELVTIYYMGIVTEDWGRTGVDCVIGPNYLLTSSGRGLYLSSMLTLILAT